MSEKRERESMHLVQKGEQTTLDGGERDKEKEGERRGGRGEGREGSHQLSPQLASIGLFFSNTLGDIEIKEGE